MATKKSESSKKSEQPKKKSNNGGSVWSLNKTSFWLIVVTAVLYLIAAVLSAISSAVDVGHVLLAITHAIMAIAEGLMICVVAVLGWRYVRNKGVAWLVLYIVVLLVILTGIVLPRFFL